MPLDDLTPMRMLGMRAFTEQFSDLLSVRATLTDYERTVIETTMESRWFDRREGDAWNQQVRAAHFILEKGFEDNPQGVCKAFQEAAHRLPFPLNAAYQARSEFDIKKTRGAEGLRRMLSLYKQFLEGPYRIALAPIAYAFARWKGRGDRELYPDAEGKVSLAALEKNRKVVDLPPEPIGCRG